MPQQMVFAVRMPQAADAAQAADAVLRDLKMSRVQLVRFDQLDELRKAVEV